MLLNDPDYALSCFYAIGQCYRARGDLFSVDFLGFGVYIFPAGAAGAMSFHDSHDKSGSYGY